jgi:hypothetical protein
MIWSSSGMEMSMIWVGSCMAGSSYTFAVAAGFVPATHLVAGT